MSLGDKRIAKSFQNPKLFLTTKENGQSSFSIGQQNKCPAGFTTGQLYFKLGDRVNFISLSFQFFIELLKGIKIELKGEDKQRYIKNDKGMTAKERLH